MINFVTAVTEPNAVRVTKKFWWNENPLTAPKVSRKSRLKFQGVQTLNFEENSKTAEEIASGLNTCSTNEKLIPINSYN